MRITEEQVRLAVKSHKACVQDPAQGAIYDHSLQVSGEAQMIKKVRDEILAMPDVREEMVLRVKEQVERGEYNPSAEDIVDAMVRREIADNIR